MEKKNILTGQKAINAYEDMQGSYSFENMPRKCGYFISDDCDSTSAIYDSESIIAFDSTDGDPLECAFSTVTDAILWINS